MRIRRILLATDLSPESVWAFPATSALARSFDAEVVLFHVVQTLTSTSRGEMLTTPLAPPDPDSLHKGVLEALDEQSLLLDHDVPTHTEIATSDRVAQAIAEHADECGADVIAMSTHGRTGFRRLVLGSVAEGVLRHANVPVFCFPNPPSPEEEPEEESEEST
jgi:nucleotide-binding universal stress UspA family protein